MHTRQEYYVTYCVLGSKVGANPLGHSCLVFSELDAEQRLEVKHIYGYYSQPSSTRNIFFKWLKRTLGIGYDLQNTHAVLKQEQMREFIADGLTGISFNISQAQYQGCIADLQNILEQQEQEITRLNEDLEGLGRDKTGVARYALQQQNLPQDPHQRLQAFHVQFSWMRYGLDTRGSSTCKQLALQFLQDHQVIDATLKETIEIQRGVRHAFPRYAGQRLQPLRFLATGPYQREYSRSGNAYCNPSFSNTENHLFWMTGPADDKPLDKQRKSLLDQYVKILSQLYAMSLQQPQATQNPQLQRIIADFHQIAISLSSSREADKAALYDRLQYLLHAGMGYLDQNLWTSSWTSRFVSSPQFYGLALVGGAVLALQWSLLSLHPAVLIVTFALSFATVVYQTIGREYQWQCMKNNYEHYWGISSAPSPDVGNFLPSLGQSPHYRL